MNTVKTWLQSWMACILSMVKGNVVFLSVAGPWNGATANDAAGFIGKYSSGWIYVYDSSGTIFSEYGVNSTPTSTSSEQMAPFQQA